MEIPKELLIRVDKILCNGCCTGEDLSALHHLEIGLESGEAETLQEFHEALQEVVA